MQSPAAHTSINSELMSIMKSMASSCCAAFLLIAALVAFAGCVNAQTDAPTTAMFVFGDSYADTGNTDPASWRRPYGETWPGWPTGRFSDGKILTDNIASIIGIETPAPHRNLSSGLGCDDFTSGVNFAHGGTGVFTTNPAPEGPTLSSQIEQFEMMSTNRCPSIKSLIDSSLVLVVMVGNDYLTFLEDHSKDKDPWALLKELSVHFIPSVVKGITDSISKLYNIGFRKFAVANLEPLGRIPYFAEADNALKLIINTLSGEHNLLLFGGIAEIRSNLAGIQIITLDQFQSFRNAQEKYFDNNLESCISICPHPEKFFFWDPIHPTQAGWKAVTDMYKEEVLNLVGTSNGQSTAVGIA